MRSGVRRLVGRNHNAVACRLHIAELESGECTVVGKEATPRTQNQRVDQEHVFIDEVGSHERLNQHSASEYQEILAAFKTSLRLRAEALRSVPERRPETPNQAESNVRPGKLSWKEQ